MTPDLLGDFPKAKFPRPVCVLVTLILLPEGRRTSAGARTSASDGWTQLGLSSSVALRQ